MPYSDEHIYVPLTEAEIAANSLAGINAALEATYTPESYAGTNLSIFTRAEDVKQKEIENSLATLPLAIVEQIKRTQLQLGSQVPCSTGFIYAALLGLKAIDGGQLLRGARFEPISPGKMAIFVLGNDDYSAALTAGDYDELFATFFFDNIATGTELAERATPALSSEVIHSVAHSTIYTTQQYKYYTATPAVLDEIAIKVTAPPNTILDEQSIIDIFAERFGELYAGANYTPDAYILTSDILGALRVSVTTTLGGASYPDDKPITGAFVALDPAAITVELVSL